MILNFTGADFGGFPAMDVITPSEITNDTEPRQQPILETVIMGGSPTTGTIILGGSFDNED